MNKAKQVRLALELTQRQAGTLILGRNPTQGYNQWRQWEAGEKIPSIPTQRLFELILFLSKSKRGRSLIDGFINLGKTG